MTRCQVVLENFKQRSKAEFEGGILINVLTRESINA